MKVLIIDDQPSVANMLQEYLLIARDQIQVDTAYSGTVGVEKFKLGHHDLIFCDSRMERLSGAETIKLIESFCSKENLNKPFITSITGDASKDFGHHVDMVLEKPIDIQKLLDIIDGLQSIKRKLPDDDV